MGIELAIFDLDGTLVDSLADLTDAVNYMLGRTGRPSLPIVDVRRLVGQGARRLVERALPDVDGTGIDEALKCFLAYNEAHIADKTRLYPGCRETLENLAGFGTRLAIISNKNVAHCRQLLEALNIGGYFEVVMGADSHPERKPSPAPILKLLADAGLGSGDAVMVGDSINDIAAGRGAGVVTVGCSYGYGDLAELAEADYIVGGLPELIELPLWSEKLLTRRKPIG